MNILIPDSWLRDYLKTKATPEQIKEYLSLCGPSVERIVKTGKDVVYDIEITSNRPDAMSVVGIAREAAAILPRFGIPAVFTGDPYAIKKQTYTGNKKLTIRTNATLNPRWTTVVLSNVRVGPSPVWMQKRLEATGIRPINNVVDTTNYLMRAYGQPVHAFDYDQIAGHTMVLRASRKGEKIVTLDGKTHKLPGEDIVITDGNGRLIDLCGIMGGYNSSIKQSTTTVVLFVQTYNPVNIRKTSMALAHRTDASSLFEKGLDPELVLPTITRAVELLQDLTGARVASRLWDIYPKPYKPHQVKLSQEKLDMYLGTQVQDIPKILSPLGFAVGKHLTISVPSWRRDVTADVDVIEEIARIWGYHNIKPALPSTAPPVVLPDSLLQWEMEIKIRLRDWGFTELYTYSMISANLMDSFGLDKKKAYKIQNPLSEEWLYMRPHLYPSVLAAVKENLRHTDEFTVFELGMAYHWRPHDLPLEVPTLNVVWTGKKYREAKGMGEAILTLFGIHPNRLGEFGKVEELDGVTRLYLDVALLATNANPAKSYVPIPKYPPVIEDFSFIIPPDFQVGPVIDVLSKVHPLVHTVRLLDAFENKRTFRVEYLDPKKTLTTLDVAPVRQKIIEYATEKFGVTVSG